MIYVKIYYPIGEITMKIIEWIKNRIQQYKLNKRYKNKLKELKNRDPFINK